MQEGLVRLKSKRPICVAITLSDDLPKQKKKNNNKIGRKYCD